LDGKILQVLYIGAAFLVCVSYALSCISRKLNSRMEAWEAMAVHIDRRNAIGLAAVFATGALTLKSEEATAVAPFFGDVAPRESVSPVGDLTRQHGVLRRIVNVYAEMERRIRSGQPEIDTAAIADAAKLFRAFGEDCHERVLEERCIFPLVQEAGGHIEKLVDVLLLQHRRGREITDYLVGAGARDSIGAETSPLTEALGSMARMYDAHAAFEDTVIIPAWTAKLSKERLQEIGVTFRDMERQAFGEDGFEYAIARVKEIEQRLQISDLDVFTAPHPPSA
jgi:hemerythrin-like domain-containing protein